MTPKQYAQSQVWRKRGKVEIQIVKKRILISRSRVWFLIFTLDTIGM